MGQGDEKEDKYVVYFRELKKGLVLNKTNGSYLAKTWGDDTVVWIGKRIILFKDCVSMRGQVVDCVRVRKAPAPAQTQEPQALSRPDGGQEEPAPAKIPF